ncbi:MAG: hypothetical protein ACKV2Q_12060 [Planctomycetaceae bacterium]
MQPDSALSFQPNLTLGLLLILGVFLSVCFIVVKVLRRSTQTSQELTKLFAVIVATVFAMMIVAKFVFVSGTSNGSVRWEWKKLGNSEPLSAPPVETPRLAGELPLPTVSDALPDPSSAELPEWTRQPPRVEGSSTFVAVKSGRFATLEEAERRAFDAAGQTAVRHFRHLDPSGVGQCVPIQRELVRQQAIRDRFEEISRHDFGTMKNFPMHQVWLRVELSPPLGERIASPWREAVVAARLQLLTGWSLWGTATAALIAFALRLDSAWNGRRRAVVVGMTLVLALGSLAFLA